MSLVGRPRTHIAGDILVSGLGALQYVSRALKKEELRVPPGPVLPAIRCFIVLTAVSALLFECGWYAEHSLCCTPQLVRNSAVKWVVMVSVCRRRRMSLSVRQSGLLLPRWLGRLWASPRISPPPPDSRIRRGGSSRHILNRTGGQASRESLGAGEVEMGRFRCILCSGRGSY